MLPPPQLAYATQEEAITAIKQFAISQGYMVSLIEARKTGYTRFRCDRGQKYRPSHNPAKLKRKTVSRQTGCPFQVNTHRHDGRWVVKVTNGEHNHEPSDDIRAHPLARKMSVAEMEIVKKGVAQGMPPRVIMGKLKEFNPSTLVKTEDIYNTRAGMRQRKMDGLSPVQQLRFRLKVSGYQFKFHQDERGHVQRVFFAHPKSVQYVTRFSEAFVFEVRKNTNRYLMPLLVISGITANNSVFPAAFAFVRNDDVENYSWALEQFILQVFPPHDDSLPSDGGHPHHPNNVIPPVVAVPGNIALQQAIEQVVPQWTILGSWPAAKSEAFDVALQYEKDEERQKLFVDAWDQVLASESPVEFESRMSDLDATFGVHSPQLIHYLDDTWISGKERLVQAWTNQYMHFGIIYKEGFFTSEGFALSSTGDLLDSFVRIESAIKSVLRKVSLELEYTYNSRVTLDDVTAQLFEGLVGRISRYALELTIKEYRRAKNFIGGGRHDAIAEEQTHVTTEIADSAVDPQVVDSSLAVIGADAAAAEAAVAAVEAAVAVQRASEISNMPDEEGVIADVSITMGIPNWKLISQRLEEANGQLHVNDFHKHWDIDSSGTEYPDEMILRDPLSPQHISDSIDTALQVVDEGRTKCSLCRGIGHNARRCPRKDELAAVEQPR